MPLPDAPMIRDTGPLTARLYAHVIDDPAQATAFMTVVGIIGMIMEEGALAQDMLRRYDERRTTPGADLVRGLQLGKIEMANRTVRAVEEGLRNLPEPVVADHAATPDGPCTCTECEDGHA